MTPKINYADLLLQQLQFLTEDEREQFTMVDVHQIVVEIMTDKAALINGNWYPKSQMRTDEDNIFIANWLLAKKPLV